jgi:oligosaccharide repeat unit polymerase
MGMPVLYNLVVKKGDVFKSLNIFVLAYLLYFAIPSLYYVLVPGIIQTGSLDKALGVSIVGLAAFYAGYLSGFGLVIRSSLLFVPNGRPSRKRVQQVTLTFSALALLSLFLFFQRTGGFIYYLRNLDKAGVLTAGNLYFVWGILLFKLGFLVWFAYRSRAGELAWHSAAPYALTALAITALTGARLLLVVTVVEIVIIVHYGIRRISLGRSALIILLIVLIVIGGYGEYRIYASTDRTLSFPRYLQHVTVDYPSEVFAHFFGNFFDSVYTLSQAVEQTSADDLLLGRSYAQIVLQPLPRSMRIPLFHWLTGEGPSSFAEQRQIEGFGYGRVLSIVGELYINFHIPGVLTGMFLLGAFAKAVYCLLIDRSDNVSVILLYALTLSAMLSELRGPFIGATTFFLTDLIPVFMAVRYISGSRPRRLRLCMKR